MTTDLQFTIVDYLKAHMQRITLRTIICARLGCLGNKKMFFQYINDHFMMWWCECYLKECSLVKFAHHRWLKNVGSTHMSGRVDWQDHKIYSDEPN